MNGSRGEILGMPVGIGPLSRPVAVMIEADPSDRVEDLVDEPSAVARFLPELQLR
jgi:hypothetical protein